MGLMNGDHGFRVAFLFRRRVLVGSDKEEFKRKRGILFYLVVEVNR